MDALKIATLGYHEVTDDPTDSGFQRPLAFDYKHTRGVFSEHLDAIGDSHLTPELVADIDFAVPGEHLLLTFDDGGKSALYIAEELCRRGWRGHFLITTSLMGSRTFLSKQEVRMLRRSGHLIGSHSHTHPDIFHAQSWHAMTWQWRTSCDTLTQILGEPCVVGSVPGGDISETVLRCAEASDIRYLFTSEPRMNPWRVGQCQVIGRVSVKANTPITRVRDFAALRGWRAALVRRRCSVFARMLLPSLYRLYVRRRTRVARA